MHSKKHGFSNWLVERGWGWEGGDGLLMSPTCYLLLFSFFSLVTGQEGEGSYAPPTCDLFYYFPFCLNFFSNLPVLHPPSPPPPIPKVVHRRDELVVSTVGFRSRRDELVVLTVSV